MVEKIDELKKELDKLKSSLHFWKTITLLLVIDIPLVSAMILNMLGMAEMNSADVDFYYIRVSSAIFVISSIIIMAASNLCLVLKDDC